MNNVAPWYEKCCVHSFLGSMVESGGWGASNNENSSHWTKANCRCEKVYCQGELSLSYGLTSLELNDVFLYRIEQATLALLPLLCLFLNPIYNINHCQNESASNLVAYTLLMTYPSRLPHFLASQVFHSNWLFGLTGNGGGANATSSGQEAANDRWSSHRWGSSICPNWGAQNAFHITHYFYM